MQIADIRKINMKSSLPEISLAEVLAGLSNPNYCFIDIRHDSFYNGFCSPHTLRGGHFPGAIHFSSDWLSLISPEKFESFVAGKGITHNKTLIFYGDNVHSPINIANHFKDRGFQVRLFNDFIHYTKNENNPLYSFKNYHWSVSSQWLNELMQEKTVESYNNQHFIILEAGYGDAPLASYQEQHIASAYFFDTCLIEQPPLWNLSSPEVIKRNLCLFGIQYDTTVILYSRDQLAALRVFSALKWAGVKDVRFLNGGFNSWIKSGFPLEKGFKEPIRVTNFGVSIPQNPQFNITTPQNVLKAIEQDNLQLISIRAWQEYIGAQSGYNYISKKGEPYGAIWGFSGKGADNLDDYFDPDGTLRNPLEILQLWKGQNINHGDYLAFYCGTGWRAAIPWFLTQLIGWENTLIFDGGWNSWHQIPSLPIQIGAPNNMTKPDALNDYS